MISFTKENLLFTFASNYTTNYFMILKIHFYHYLSAPGRLLFQHKQKLL